MVLDGSLDKTEAPPTADPNADRDGDGFKNEIPTSLVDHLEFYLLNYFNPGTHQQTQLTQKGLKLFNAAGCNSCHIQNLQINRDRRVADVETVYDPVKGIFNNLFSTATAFFTSVNDGSGFPTLKDPNFQPFLSELISESSGGTAGALACDL